MTKRMLAITLSMLLIISMLPAIALGTSVTLDLSMDSATVETSIIASGSADPDEWVSIKVLDSSGNIVLFDAVKSNASGDYCCTFIVPQVSPGILTVVAGDGSNVANKSLTISGSGGDDSVAVMGISLNKSSTSIAKDASETLLATVVPANASNKAVTWSSNKEAVATVDGDGKVTAVGYGTTVITVTTVDGNKTASCTVTVSKQETATDGGTITIADTPLTITVPQGVTSTITVTQNTALPLVEVNSDKVDMTIPQGAQVNGSNSIQLPEVMSSSSVNVAAAKQVDLVIKVGSDLGTITFSKPVRLVLKGQGQKSAGFIDNNGKFQAITKLASLKGLTNDADADAVGLALSNAGLQQAAVVSANDLIIWTKHFTKFIAYMPTTGGSTGGRGGGSNAPSGQTIGSSGGTIKEAGAIVTFPADAVSGNIKVTIKKLTSGIPTVSEFKLVGKVYKISSNKTSDFKKPVKITLPFNSTKVDTDKYDVGIYCWTNKQWVVLDKVKVNTATGKVSGEVNHFSKFAVLAAAKEVEKPVAVLSDVAGNWAAANINKLLTSGVIGGYPDGSFKPGNRITRAEFASVLVKAFKLEPQKGKVFNDTSSHWAKDYIATATANKIVKGYSDTLFGPDDYITREQMAVMIVNAAKLSRGSGSKIFTDSAEISPWAQDAISIASSNKIITGYPDNSFNPRGNATRAEAVTVIVKTLGQQ